MASIAGIHILSDKKAKILTALKASLRESEKIAEYMHGDSLAEDQIKSDDYKKLYGEFRNALGDAFSQSTAIVLYDDYVSLLIEDAETDEIESRAAEFSEVFGKPVLYTLILDGDAAVFGAAREGKIRTRLVCGEYPDEYDLEHECINMDLLAYIYNAKNLTDLNSSDSVQDLVYTLEEDYGIYADVSPISIPLFEERYKLLEKSTSFSVYSAL